MPNETVIEMPDISQTNQTQPGKMQMLECPELERRKLLVESAEALIIEEIVNNFNADVLDNIALGIADDVVQNYNDLTLCSPETTAFSEHAEDFLARPDDLIEEISWHILNYLDEEVDVPLAPKVAARFAGPISDRLRVIFGGFVYACIDMKGAAKELCRPRKEAEKAAARAAKKRAA